MNAQHFKDRYILDKRPTGQNIVSQMAFPGWHNGSGINVNKVAEGKKKGELRRKVNRNQGVDRLAEKAANPELARNKIKEIAMARTLQKLAKQKEELTKKITAMQAEYDELVKKNRGIQ